MANFLLSVLAIVLCYISVHEAAPTQSIHAMFHTSVNNSVVAPPLSNTASQFLDGHNVARAQVGVPPLKWNEEQAQYARQWVLYQKAFGCNFADLKNLKYSSNQVWTSGIVLSPRKAVDFWVSQSKYYDYTTNTCSVAEDYCETYKQVVSKYLKEVGCSRTHCVGFRTINTLSICFYSPGAGDHYGERPY